MAQRRYRDNLAVAVAKQGALAPRAAQQLAATLAARKAGGCRSGG